MPPLPPDQMLVREPWRRWPVETWEACRALYEEGLTRHPNHKPTKQMIQLCDFYIARSRG